MPVTFSLLLFFTSFLFPYISGMRDLALYLRFLYFTLFMNGIVRLLSSFPSLHLRSTNTSSLGVFERIEVDGSDKIP